MFFNIFEMSYFSILKSSFSASAVHPTTFWVNLGPFWRSFWALETPPPPLQPHLDSPVGAVDPKSIFEPFLAPPWHVLRPFGVPWGAL